MTTVQPAAAGRQGLGFGKLALLLVPASIGVAVAISVMVWQRTTDPLRYQKRFHRTISSTDKIVVRDGGYDCCGPVDGQKVLFEVVDPMELAEVRNHICFAPGTPSDGCLCCGYPGIDWYCGNKRIALTSVQHGVALRWKGFPGDAHFTEESAQWLRQWFKRHGLSKSELHW